MNHKSGLFLSLLDGLVSSTWHRGTSGGTLRTRADIEVTNQDAKRFEGELDRGVQEIAADVARLDREHMLADSSTLTAALERDLIDPTDFCR